MKKANIKISIISSIILTLALIFTLSFASVVNNTNQNSSLINGSNQSYQEINYGAQGISSYTNLDSNLRPGIDLTALKPEFQDIIGFYDLSSNADNSLYDISSTHSGNIVFDSTNNHATFSGGYINSDLNANLNGNSYTISFWFKTTYGTDKQNILGSGYDNLNNQDNQDGRMGIQFQTDGKILIFQNANLGNKNNKTDLTYNDGNWHFLTLVVNSNSAELLIDNSVEASIIFTRGPPSQTWKIGALDTETTKPFYGEIRDVAFFKSALTNSEILELSTIENSNQLFNLEVEKSEGLEIIKEEFNSILSLNQYDENANIYIQYLNSTTIDTQFDLVYSHNDKRYLINYGEENYDLISSISNIVNVIQIEKTDEQTIRTTIQNILN